MPDVSLPLVFSRRQALEAGLSRGQVARCVASGRWTPLRHGLYCRTESFVAADDRRRHQLACMSALAAARPDAERQPAEVLPDVEGIPWSAVSHLSAASFYAWPQPWRGWPLPHITVHPERGRPRRRAGMVVQAAELTADDVTVREGVRLTTAGRTIADLLRSLPVAEAVAVADHALRTGGVEHADVVGALRRQSGWPYVARGRQAFALVDPRRESWLESWSFVSLYLQGIPLPVPQAMVFDEHGRFVARVDALWPQASLVGEADGAVKYALDGPFVDPGTGSTTDAIAWGQRRLDDQRRRHERLLDLGLHVVRWSAKDVSRNRGHLVHRLHERLLTGDPSTFRGRFVLPGPLPWADPNPTNPRLAPDVHGSTPDLPRSRRTHRA